ncbi:MAG TPA: hypothetical protein VJO33_15745 [Gemmatimonadaceae bacterium]|nr:hypothetical protein [Gemmatimonadaceae bacterium]
MVRFVGLGVSGSYSNASSSQSLGTSSREEVWSAGVYGELGLQYLFTRHLGLGVRGDVVGSGNSVHIMQGASTTQRLTSYRVVLEPPQIIGTFYF